MLMSMLQIMWAFLEAQAFSTWKEVLQFQLLYELFTLIIFQEGWTPLHVAIQSRNRDIAKILIGNGADRLIKNKVMFCIFHYSTT
jgi:ankyrin repeat protein